MTQGFKAWVENKIDNPNGNSYGAEYDDEIGY